jgi:AcrR family transcriptional regulator
VTRRRRGAALETAILDAAWDELADRGYADFTVDGVVKRAETSPPVVYRRYADRSELARAALSHALGKSRRVDVPNTGSLRQDLLDLLHTINANCVQLVTMMSMQLAGYYAATGRSLGDLFEAARAQAAEEVTILYDRAADRGEIDPGSLTDRIKSLPFDLLRQEILTTYAPVPAGVLEEIVDTIVLPLVR